MNSLLKRLALLCAFLPTLAFAQGIPVTPNIGLQNPLYGSANWQNSWYYNNNVLDLMLSGNRPVQLTTWQSTATYAQNTIVAYLGIFYESLANGNQGNLPTNTTYWAVSVGSSGSLPSATALNQVPSATGPGTTYVARSVSNQVCVENYLNTADGHSGTDYGYAFNAADAYLETNNVTAGTINFCSPGSHPVWAPLVESWPVALIDGTGSVLIPQSGGASGAWGASPVNISGCTVTAGSATVSCSGTTGLAANMAVGGIGLGSANRISGAPSGSSFQLAIPAVLTISGITTSGSNQVCGLNTIRGIATGQGVSGAGIPASTTITAITPYSASNGQCITISNSATATSTQYSVGNQVNAPVTLTISGSWTANITAEATAPVLDIPYNSSAALNWASQNYTGKIAHLTIEDPGYRTLTGVDGVEVWGQDGFQSSDIAVYGIRGTCLTLGGYDSTRPLRESFFSDTKCVNDGDLPTGQSAIIIAANGSSTNDEPNQIKFSGGEIVYSHGEGVTIGTYIASHQGSNGPRLLFFSDNFQVESGNADANNPDIAAPADNIHTLTGSQIYFSGAEIAVPGYGKALYQQDNTAASNSYEVNNSSLISAGNRVTYTVAVTNGSTSITFPSGLTPTDNIFDGVGIQLGGVDYWFTPEDSVSGQTGTLTQAYQGSSGTATMTIGAGGFFFNNTASFGVLDTRTTVGNIWTEIDPTAISLLGFGSPITVGIDQGALPGRGVNDNLGLQTYNTLDVNAAAIFHALTYTPGGIYSTGVITSALEGIFSNPNNIPLSASTGAANAVNQPVTFTCPNTPTGDDCALFLGLNNTTNGQSAILGWHNAATPYGWLGVYGANQLITWNSTGVNMSVPVTAPNLPGLIQRQTLSSAAASVTFSGVPQNFTNLRLVVSAQGASSSDTALQIQFNGDTAAHYTQSSQTIANGTATSTAAGGETSGKIGLISDTTGNGNNMNGTTTATIFDYTNTVNVNVASQAALFLSSGSATQFSAVVNWQGSAAVTSITLIGGAGENFEAGSVFSLYGEQ